MEQTVPRAAYVRAKIYQIETGEEKWIDYRKVIGILKRAGFNGNMSITYEGGPYNQCSDREAARLAAVHLRKLLWEMEV